MTWQHVNRWLDFICVKALEQGETDKFERPENANIARGQKQGS